MVPYIVSHVYVGIGGSSVNHAFVHCLGFKLLSDQPRSACRWLPDASFVPDTADGRDCGLVHSRTGLGEAPAAIDLRPCAASGAVTTKLTESSRSVCFLHTPGQGTAQPGMWHGLFQTCCWLRRSERGEEREGVFRDMRSV